MEKNGTMAATAETASLNGHGDFIARQRLKLEELKKSFINEVEILSSHESIDVNSQSDPSWERRCRMLNDKIKFIDNISMKRIDNNVYMTCTKCGGEIERAILEKCPMAIICHDCVPPEPIKKRRAY